MSITRLDDDRSEEGLCLLEPRFSLSLQRGLAILQCYSPEQSLLGIAELADMLALSRSTTHRYVTTLVALGYLRQGAGRKYQLALGVTRLGLEAMNATSLADHAQPLLLGLSQRTGLTASLAVLDGPVLVYVDQFRGSRSRGITERADPSPHNTALGKLLLAYLPVVVRRQTIAQLGLSKTGPKTITSKKRLSQELREIREDGGLAEADEELAPHTAEIAAAVRNGSQEVVAAVSLAVATKTDVEALARELGPHL
ncbi:MAG TPA: IclR family transcriptional regulator, partial [Propionibacteriaceae bacterium]|nr:IclR family transcriptional regulator [Propionibacteriaceae bacterium]